MKNTKKNDLSKRVALSLGVVLSFGANGDYDYDKYTKDIAKTESTLGSFNSSVKSFGVSSFADEIDKAVKGAEALATKNKEELENRIKLRKWVEKNDALRNAIGLPDLVIQNALKKRSLELSKAESLASQLTNNTPLSSSLTTNDLPKACKKNVDFTQLRTILDDMNSSPFQYLQKQAQSLLNETIKENKEKQQAKLGDLFKYYKELSSREDNVESLKGDADKSPEGVEKRVEELKKKNPEQKALNKELKETFVDKAFGMIKQLVGIQENDKNLDKVRTEFVNMIESKKKTIQAVIDDQGGQLLSNCEKEINQLRSDIISSQTWMVRAGINAEAAFADVQNQLNQANGMECRDIRDSAKAAFSGSGGNNFNSRLQSIKTEKNPTKLLAEAGLILQDLGQVQQQIDQEVQPLMQDCEEAAQAREVVEARLRPIKPQAGVPAGNGGRTNSVSGSSLASTASGANRGVRPPVNSTNHNR